MNGNIIKERKKYIKIVMEENQTLENRERKKEGHKRRELEKDYKTEEKETRKTRKLEGRTNRRNEQRKTYRD